MSANTGSKGGGKGVEGGRQLFGREYGSSGLEGLGKKDEEASVVTERVLGDQGGEGSAEKG